jgi:hypothetical protein
VKKIAHGDQREQHRTDCPDGCLQFKGPFLGLLQPARSLLCSAEQSSSLTLSHCLFLAGLCIHRLYLFLLQSQVSPLVRADARQVPMTDRIEPAKPLKTLLKFATPCKLASRTYPLAVGVQPTNESTTGAPCGRARGSSNRTDLRVVKALNPCAPTSSQMDRPRWSSSISLSTSTVRKTNWEGSIDAR